MLPCCALSSFPVGKKKGKTKDLELGMDLNEVQSHNSNTTAGVVDQSLFILHCPVVSIALVKILLLRLFSVDRNLD